MSCCAPGTEAALDMAGAGGELPPSEELLLASRPLGNGCRQIDLSVPGVHCGTCITTLEGALAGQADVLSARVNLSTRRLSVVFREAGEGGPVDPRAILAPLAGTGYAVHLFTPGEEETDRELQGLIRAVAVSGFAAANIMLLSVSVWSGADHATRDLFHWISAMIAGPALIYAGRFFYLSAFRALRHGRTNMDVPIALAVTLSYCMSLYETIHHGAHAWFDASVTLLFFLLIGRTLDHLMRGRARSAISGLARLMPRGAMVERDDGAREYRATADIRPGDRILVAAGDRIPVDGTVLTGASDLDCSLVNGESAPVPVKAGVAVQGVR